MDKDGGDHAYAVTDGELIPWRLLGSNDAGPGLEGTGTQMKPRDLEADQADVAPQRLACQGLGIALGCLAKPD